MTRIKVIDRAEMNDEQGRMFDTIKGEGGPVGGPYWAYIRNPKLMRLAQDISNCLRAGPLSDRERQIAILTVIRFWGAKYPWAVQVRNSLGAGVDQDIVDAINARHDPDLSDARERAAYEVAKELVADHGLSDATYAAAEKAFGVEDLVDLVAVIGQFSMVCCTANAFDITPPDEAPARLA
jgi:4-carboxymuconolactone decarboxylase